MGWERNFIPKIGALFDALAKKFPAGLTIPKEPALIWGKEGAKQASANHKAMAWNLELARAAVWGTPQEYAAAREVVLFYLDLELKQVGLWTQEQFTGAPHGGMHMDAMLAGRVASRHKNDSELLRLQDDHFRRLATYLAATATPGGEIWCCGERMPQGPGASQQTAIYRELHGLPHRGDLAKNAEKKLKDDFWVSVRGFRALQASGDDFGGARDITPSSVTGLPFVKRRVEVMRWNGGHLARYTSPDEGGKDACGWVLVDHQAVDQGNSHGVRFEVGFKTAAPIAEVPPGAQPIRTA